MIEKCMICKEEVNTDKEAFYLYSENEEQIICLDCISNLDRRTINIDKAKLNTMIREFWSCCNNKDCEIATIAFLRESGLTDMEIKNWLDLEKLRVTKKQVEEYHFAIDDTRRYYGDYGG